MEAGGPIGMRGIAASFSLSPLLKSGLIIPYLHIENDVHLGPDIHMDIDTLKIQIQMT